MTVIFYWHLHQATTQIPDSPIKRSRVHHTYPFDLDEKKNV